MNKKCLIIGAGFVGGTCYKVFHQLKNWDVQVHDLNPGESQLEQTFRNEFEDSEINWADPEGLDATDSIKSADLIFVALPTPMIKDTGECHIGIVESAIKEVRKVNQDSWICIKSTVPPGTTQEMYQKWGRVCFNPEFLTEANALQDFRELRYQIIGSPHLMPGICDSVDNPIFDLYSDCRIQKLLNIDDAAVLDLHSTQAEMIKYMRNCYLATRLSFFNEMAQICDASGLDFVATKWWAGLDSRVGQHYSEIDPEEPEFSGSCLPKDVNALIFFMKSLGGSPTMLEAVWKKNLEVAKKKTWEGEVGRAVLEDEQS